MVADDWTRTCPLSFRANYTCSRARGRRPYDATVAPAWEWAQASGSRRRRNLPDFPDHGAQRRDRRIVLALAPTDVRELRGDARVAPDRNGSLGLLRQV